MTQAIGLSTESLLAIVKEVFETMVELGLDGGNGDGRRIDQGPTTISSISITGEWNGVVYLHCSSKLASAVSQDIFKTDADSITDEDIEDAMGEMINMIGGNVKMLLPAPSNLSLPNVVRGIDCSCQVPGGDEVQCLHARCAGEDLYVHVLEASSGGRASR